MAYCTDTASASLLPGDNVTLTNLLFQIVHLPVQQGGGQQQSRSPGYRLPLPCRSCRQSVLAYRLPAKGLKLPLAHGPRVRALMMRSGQICRS